MWQIFRLQRVEETTFINMNEAAMLVGVLKMSVTLKDNFFGDEKGQ